MAKSRTDADEHDGDLSDDCVAMLLEDSATGHVAFVEDQAASEQILGDVVDAAAGRKFDEVDPIEAAAAEVILKTAP